MSPFNPDPQNRYPSPRSDNGQSRDGERVIEAEIIHDGCDDGRGQGPYGHSCRGGYGQEQFRGCLLYTSGNELHAGLKDTAAARLDGIRQLLADMEAEEQE